MVLAIAGVIVEELHTSLMMVVAKSTALDGKHLIVAFTKTVGVMYIFFKRLILHHVSQLTHPYITSYFINCRLKMMFKLLETLLVTSWIYLALDR